MLKALDFCRYAPTEIETTTIDGRRLQVDLTSRMHETVFFLGEYEKAVTDAIGSVVKPGDVCLDVGANFGWYTTLLHRLCGGANRNGTAIGTVHAFEPLPEVFKILKQNWLLAGSPENVFLNNIAVGDENRSVTLHRFDELPSGHTSLSTMGKSGFQALPVEMKTLDSYLEEKKVGDVNFVKVDIEGAELMFLRGATALFKQKLPPILMMEMALATSRGFGYVPNDLIDFLRETGGYRFYWINDYTGSLRLFDRFSPEEIGAHVLCVPQNCEADRLNKLKLFT